MSYYGLVGFNHRLGLPALRSFMRRTGHPTPKDTFMLYLCGNTSQEVIRLIRFLIYDILSVLVAPARHRKHELAQALRAG